MKIWYYLTVLTSSYRQVHRRTCRAGCALFSFTLWLLYAVLSMPKSLLQSQFSFSIHPWQNLLLSHRFTGFFSCSWAYYYDSVLLTHFIMCMSVCLFQPLISSQLESKNCILYIIGTPEANRVWHIKDTQLMLIKIIRVNLYSQK